MNPGSALIMGIDGGGTKTVAWLARMHSAAGSVSSGSLTEMLGSGHAGPSNQRAVGTEIAMKNLDVAVTAAFNAAGMERQTTAAACLGLAGADRESDRRVVEDWAARCRLAERVRVVNDALPLLYAVDGPVQPTGCGVALICGTGSLAFGRNQQGRTARTGGWGYLFGDEGSAFAIGQAALRAATQAADGRAASTVLLARVMERLRITSDSELVPAVYGHPDPRSAIAQLADEVFSAANDGDPVAARIVDQALTQLLQMVTTLARRLNLERSLDLFLTGGILLHQQAFRQQLLNAITSRQLTLSTVHVVAEPVLGAVRMAAQQSETNGISDNSEQQNQ